MRTFNLVEGTSDKFWHIDVAGDTVTVRFGRNGTAGQVRSTRHESAAQAAEEADKLVVSKVRKGYVEGGPGGPIVPVATTPTVAPVRTPVRAPRPEPAAPNPEPAPERTKGAGPAPRPVALDPGDPADLGLVLHPFEEAALAWGRPLDAAPQAGPAFAPQRGEAAVRAHGVTCEEYYADLVFPTLPFDAVPSPEEGRWWLWWLHSLRPAPGEPRYPWPTRAQRFARARDQYLTLPPPALDPVVGADTWFVRVAAELAVRPPAAVLRGCCRGQVPDAGAVPALRALVLPRLDAAALAEARRDLTTRSAGPLAEAVVSALIADPQEHLDRLERSPDDLLVEGSSYQWEALVAVLSALPGRDDAVRLAERFGHDHTAHTYCAFRPPLIPGLLGALGVEALPLLARRVAAETNRTVAQAHLAFLAPRVTGPGAVATMVRLAHAAKAPGQARAWVAAHPVALAAAPGTFRGDDLAVVAAAVRKAVTDQPDAFGADVANPTVRSTLDALREDTATPVVVPGAEPAWWLAAVAAEQALQAGGARRLPAWLESSPLPPLVVDGLRLNPAMVEAALLSALRAAALPDLVTPPLVVALRDRLRPVDRDAVASALLDAWLGEGAPAKEKAVFVAAGFLGADGFVARLLPLVREWPGQSQHARAVLGLDVLVATGRLSGLQGISGIASASKFKGVQEAARRAMHRLAAAAGLTPDQLADRVVPDGGLDRRGTRVLAYGPRSFRVSLSSQGKLVVRDLDDAGRPAGKARTALPAPNSKDDAAAAQAAKAEFTVLRKQLTDLAKVQTARLEQAMISGRTWSGAEHREHLTANPLLNSLIRPLVWSIVAGGSRTLARVTEDREYLTVDDDVVVPADDVTVALAHPLHLTATERAAWHEHLVSYDLIPPIEQLDRAVHVLPPGQDGTDLLPSALPKGRIHPGTLVGLLDRHGWRRGHPADGGVITFAWLPFPTYDRAVVIDLADGLWVGVIGESGDQQINAAIVTPLAAPADAWYLDGLRERIPWTAVDPLVVSETLRSLAAIAEKTT